MVKIPDLKNIEYYIFDLDGTMIDSSKYHEKSFQSVLQKEKVLDFKYDDIKGKKTLDVFLHFGFKYNKAVDLTKNKQEIYREYLLKGVIELFKGTYDLFNLLYEKNKKIYIATSASHEATQLIIDIYKLNKYLVGYITGDDVKHSKPNPEIFTTLINKYLINKKKAVVIEDSYSGLQAAKSAGLNVLIVNNREINSETPSFHTIYDLYNYCLKQYTVKV